jgi:hypothetical protein
VSGILSDGGGIFLPLFPYMKGSFYNQKLVFKYAEIETGKIALIK